jgi:hypothetical protein
VDWSSSFIDEEAAWWVSFGCGAVGNHDKDADDYVRCVRGETLYVL